MTRWINNEDEIHNERILNFSWAIPLIPAETNHERLFSWLSSQCQLPGLSTAYRKRLECHATITPFFQKHPKKPPLHCPPTVSLKWAQAAAFLALRALILAIVWQRLYLLLRLCTVFRVILQALPHQFLYSQTEMAQGSLRWSFVDFVQL